MNIAQNMRLNNKVYIFLNSVHLSVLIFDSIIWKQARVFIVAGGVDLRTCVDLWVVDRISIMYVTGPVNL